MILVLAQNFYSEKTKSRLECYDRVEIEERRIESCGETFYFGFSLHVTLLPRVYLQTAIKAILCAWFMIKMQLRILKIPREIMPAPHKRTCPINISCSLNLWHSRKWAKSTIKAGCYRIYSFKIRDLGGLPCRVINVRMVRTQVNFTHV